MPALLEIMVSPLTPLSRIASISTAGMPHRPKPPDMIVISSRNSPARAVCASAYTLLTAILRPPARATCHWPGARSKGLAARQFRPDLCRKLWVRPADLAGAQACGDPRITLALPILQKPQIGYNS